jgi:hypothetical protein
MLIYGKLLYFLLSPTVAGKTGYCQLLTEKETESHQG